MSYPMDNLGLELLQEIKRILKYDEVRIIKNENSYFVITPGYAQSIGFNKVPALIDKLKQLNNNFSGRNYGKFKTNQEVDRCEQEGSCRYSEQDQKTGSCSEKS